MKYFRLLRLQDQYIQVGVAISAFILLKIRNFNSWFWILSTFFISITAFIINELVDREDVDKYSWNPIHVKLEEKLNKNIVTIMFILISFFGLLFAYLSAYFWWGIMMYIIGILYSVKPIRLKGRFAFDILAQSMVWIVIPAGAPLWMHYPFFPMIFFLATMTLILWGSGFPYQLADYQADFKTGLKCTHIVLGMKNSLFMGLFFSILGIVFFIVFRIFNFAAWFIPIIGMGIYMIIRYIFWLRLTTIKKQIASLQENVRLIKPLTQLFLPYLLLIWFFLT